MEEPWVAEALARNDRYLVEFIEALSLCPFAKTCRETGRLYRRVLGLMEPEVAPLVAAVQAIEAEPEGSVEVGLLILPRLALDARTFERFVSDVRRAYEGSRSYPTGFFLVAFHPDHPMDLANADRAVTFLRRSPDPTIQVVSAAATDKARAGAGDPKELSRAIAERGLRAVHEADPERLAGLLAEIQRLGRSGG